MNWMLLLIPVGILAFFFVDVRFYISDITISGNKLASSEEIRQATGLYSWSIFYVDAEQVATTLRKQFPCIRSVRVRCRLPARVFIELEEREPRAIWETKTGRYLVDGEGVVLRPAESVADMLLIKDHTDQAIQPGDRLDMLAVQTVEQLYGLLKPTRVFHYTSDKGIAVSGPNGWPVFFGLGGDLNAKVANLAALVQEIQRRGIPKVEYVDLRFENRPLYCEARSP